MELKKVVKAVALATMLSISVLATNANAFGINDEVIYATNQNKYPEFWKESTDKYGNKYYILKNNQSVLNYFNNNKWLKVKATPNCDSVTIHQKSQYSNQCVAFVRATGWEDFGPADEWQKIYKLDKDVVKNLSSGTQIATFSPNGKYGNPEENNPYTGHVAVFLKAVNDGIWVVDQNYYSDGKVTMHFIRFNKSNKVGDAGAYWVFQKP